tara:strand:- start:15551 stop:15757 length:207 start_codon:yes stop_codon:yes gene_type:complete
MSPEGLSNRVMQMWDNLQDEVDENSLSAQDRDAIIVGLKACAVAESQARLKSAEESVKHHKAILKALK